MKHTFSCTWWLIFGLCLEREKNGQTKCELEHLNTTKNESNDRIIKEREEL